MKLKEADLVAFCSFCSKMQEIYRQLCVHYENLMKVARETMKRSELYSFGPSVSLMHAGEIFLFLSLIA